MGYGLKSPYRPSVGYYGGVSAPPVTTNVAASSNGSVATATSAAAATPVDAAINSVRHTNSEWGTGTSGTGNGWGTVSGTPAPWTLTVTFAQTYTLTQIDLYGLADAVNYNTAPTAATVATQYGFVDFTIEAKVGASWVLQQTVTGNNKVLRSFPLAVSASAVRVTITASMAASGYIVELEAQGY